MKKILLSTVCALSLSATAFAADLPRKAAPMMMEPAINWTGFYIGGNLGGGSTVKRWEYFDFLANDFFLEGRHSATGALGGGQIGYRWQSGNWVFGLEAQGNWSNMRGDNVSTQFFAVNETKVNSLGMFTGQIGMTWYDALIYVKGGALVADEHYRMTDSISGAFFAARNETRWGSTVGVGLEYAFTPNWSAGIEYNHGFLGTRTLDFYDAGGFAVQTERIRQDLDMVTLRLNYKFGYVAPVVARY